MSSAIDVYWPVLLVVSTVVMFQVADADPQNISAKNSVRIAMIRFLLDIKTFSPPLNFFNNFHI